MKNLTNIFVVCVFALFTLAACSSSSPKKANYLPEIVTEIPETLNGNAEVVSFIETNTTALNQWSITFEDLVVACEPYAGKEDSVLSTMDKIKLGAIMMEFMANMGQFAVQVSDIESTITTLEDGLDETEAEALALIMGQYEKRINELGVKYENFGTPVQE